MNGKEVTFAIIKPGVVNNMYCEKIIGMIERSGLKIVHKIKVTLDEDEAEILYSCHRDKPFFDDLVSYMTSGPSTLMLISGENAVNAYRELMGSTDPKDADPDTTIRDRYGISLRQNAVHGSDSFESACSEIALFFNIEYNHR